MLSNISRSWLPKKDSSELHLNVHITSKNRQKSPEKSTFSHLHGTKMIFFRVGKDTLSYSLPIRNDSCLIRKLCIFWIFYHLKMMFFAIFALLFFSMRYYKNFKIHFVLPVVTFYLVGWDISHYTKNCGKWADHHVLVQNTQYPYNF